MKKFLIAALTGLALLVLPNHSYAQTQTDCKSPEVVSQEGADAGFVQSFEITGQALDRWLSAYAHTHGRDKSDIWVMERMDIYPPPVDGVPFVLAPFHNACLIRLVPVAPEEMEEINKTLKNWEANNGQ